MRFGQSLKIANPLKTIKYCSGVILWSENDIYLIGA